jgi:hypothetical protein
LGRARSLCDLTREQRAPERGAVNSQPSKATSPRSRGRFAAGTVRWYSPCFWPASPRRLPGGGRCVP